MEHIERAVSLFRTLAQAQPAAFLPDLATAYGMKGKILLADDRPAEAEPAFDAGLEALHPQWKQLPQAFDSLFQALLRYWGHAGRLLGRTRSEDPAELSREWLDSKS